MAGAQLRELHTPRFAIAVALIALFAAVLAPTAGATSPSQDQYGSALPGVGGGNGSGSPSTSSSSGTAESTIPVAPSSSSSTATTGSDTGSASTSSSGNGGGSSQGNSKASQKSNHSKAQSPNGSNNDTGTPAQNASQQSVPHIAADSAGDSWVPWFIGGLLALGAAGAVLVYRNRRRAAQS
jgi:hypothetical protein